MTIVKISKKQIIKAIEEEPLGNFISGSWSMFSSFDGEVKVKSKDCKVCAVGAVMRNIIHKNENACEIDRLANYICGYDHLVGDTMSFKEEALELLAEKMYMNALSVYFEGSWNKAEMFNYPLSRHQKYRIRKNTIKFVEDNFPRSIEIDIDGIKPAKDIKVIQK